jgi:hypothetical protein
LTKAVVVAVDSLFGDPFLSGDPIDPQFGQLAHAGAGGDLVSGRGWAASEFDAEFVSA